MNELFGVRLNGIMSLLHGAFSLVVIRAHMLVCKESSRVRRVWLRLWKTGKAVIDSEGIGCGDGEMKCRSCSVKYSSQYCRRHDVRLRPVAESSSSCLELIQLFKACPVA